MRLRSTDLFVVALEPHYIVLAHERTKTRFLKNDFFRKKREKYEKHIKFTFSCKFADSWRHICVKFQSAIRNVFPYNFNEPSNV